MIESFFHSVATCTSLRSLSPDPTKLSTTDILLSAFSQEHSSNLETSPYIGIFSDLDHFPPIWTDPLPQFRQLLSNSDNFTSTLISPCNLDNFLSNLDNFSFNLKNDIRPADKMVIKHVFTISLPAGMLLTYLTTE